MNYSDINDFELYYMVQENYEYSLNVMFNKYENILKKISYHYYLEYKYIGISYDDLFQEARIGLMKALRGYKENESLFYSYVLLCCERQVIDYCRNYTTLKNYPLNYSISDECINYKNYSNNKSVDSNLLSNELFMECKNILKFNYSIVFELKYNNFSNKEISKLLDLPITTIEGRLAVIRKTLKNNLNIAF